MVSPAFKWFWLNYFPRVLPQLQILNPQTGATLNQNNFFLQTWENIGGFNFFLKKPYEGLHSPSPIKKALSAHAEAMHLLFSSKLLVA